MIHSFINDSNKIKDFKGIKENALWYDCLNLTEEEKKEVINHFKLYIPSRKKMSKIGTSDRFFKKDDVIYMTLSMAAKAHSEQPTLFPVTFILSPQFLMTLRFAEPLSFPIFKKRLQETGEHWNTCADIFFGLLETIVDRTAELTEQISLEIDALSEEIFRNRTKKTTRTKELSETLTRLGKKGDLTAKINESSRSLERLFNYFNLQRKTQENQNEVKQMGILQQDTTSIIDHLGFLSHKINFLLDASLGYITIEQNGIIKIFTIMAVILLPPSLVAAVYGMNFQKIPELTWSFGYPFSLILMLASAILPYFYFRRKGWL